MKGREARRSTASDSSKQRSVAAVILGIAAATAAIVWVLDANPAARIELRREATADATEVPRETSGVRALAVADREAPATVLQDPLPARAATAVVRHDESIAPPGFLAVRVVDDSAMPLPHVGVRLVAKPAGANGANGANGASTASSENRDGVGSAGARMGEEARPNPESATASDDARVLRGRADAGRVFERVATTDRGGLAELVLPPARYRIEVDPATLPRSVLAPYAQELAAPGTWAAGLGPTIVDLQSEEHRDVVIVCRTAGIVRGRVVLADGRPVIGARVRLQGQRADYLPSVCSDATTDFAGRFEMRDVYPADYRVQVFLVECEDVFVRSIPSPVPTDFTMGSGGEHVVPDIVVPIGECTIRGRFVDESGAPFEGLLVACFPARLDGGVPNALPFGQVTTDFDGRFEFRALPRERVRISAPADYHPRMPVLERKAASFLDPIFVDLGIAQAVDVGDLRLDRSRPLIVRGVVQLDPEFVRLTNRTFGDLVLECGPEPGFVIPVEWPRRVAAHESRVAIDPQTGAFEFAVETPHPPLLIELRLAKRWAGFEGKRITIDGSLPRIEPLILRVP
jgi:hypothetical protein